MTRSLLPAAVANTPMSTGSLVRISSPSWATSTTVPSLVGDECPCVEDKAHAASHPATPEPARAAPINWSISASVRAPCSAANASRASRRCRWRASSSAAPANHVETLTPLVRRCGPNRGGQAGLEGKPRAFRRAPLDGQSDADITEGASEVRPVAGAWQHPQDHRVRHGDQPRSFRRQELRRDRRPHAVARPRRRPARRAEQAPELPEVGVGSQERRVFPYVHVCRNLHQVASYGILPFAPEQPYGIRRPTRRQPGDRRDGLAGKDEVGIRCGEPAVHRNGMQRPGHLGDDGADTCPSLKYSAGRRSVTVTGTGQIGELFQRGGRLPRPRRTAVSVVRAGASP